MPDFSMCTQQECPLSQKCLRYLATPSLTQSYHTFPGNGECWGFKPIKTHERKRTESERSPK